MIHLLLAYVYALFVKGIPGKNRTSKGIVFGLCVFAVGIVPGMFSTYYFMNVAVTVVVYWTLSSLITYPLLGIVIAAIYGE